MLDPGAGAALKVVAYFDALVETRASLEAVVRAVAAIAGCPAGAITHERGTPVRVLINGKRSDGQPMGIVRPAKGPREPTVWIERVPDDAADDGRLALDLLILERFARSTQIMLDRTRPLSDQTDPAALELLLNPDAPVAHRLEIAERLGLSSAKLRYAVVVRAAGHSSSGANVSADLDGFSVEIIPAGHALHAMGWRCALGPMGLVRDLPASYHLARETLRLTFDDAATGPLFLRADDVMGLLALAPGCDTPAATREVEAIERAIGASTWALRTMLGICINSSLRVAADQLNVHHSTLQERVDRLEHWLGWPVATSNGRTRLTVAFALRSFRLNRW